jgi:hypothetical protein
MPYTYIVDHPTQPDFWRHDPPHWEPCIVCGGPTCWVESDLAFTHPTCDMGPGYRMELGKVVLDESGET